MTRPSHYSLFYHLNNIERGVKRKGKGHPITGHQEPRGGSRGIALLILDLGARREWVVSTTPRPLYPRERQEAG
jgi:hypothetical protein